MLEDVADLFALPPGAPHLALALTHPSFANEQRDRDDNQRLEFLGDAVLQLCVSEYLFRTYPEAHEGELTRRRAQLVNSEALGRVAKELGLPDVLRLGKGAETSGLRNNTGVLADAVEALIAASFLEAGMQAAQAACTELLHRIEASLDSGQVKDAKSELQERVQAHGFEAPVYELVESGGSKHDPWFEVAAKVSGNALARGRGRNKRQAEREAAKSALEALPTFLGEEPEQ